MVLLTQSNLWMLKAGDLIVFPKNNIHTVWSPWNFYPRLVVDVSRDVDIYGGLLTVKLLTSYKNDKPIMKWDIMKLHLTHSKICFIRL